MTPEELGTFFMKHGYHLKGKSYISPSGEVKYKLAKNSLQKFRKGTYNPWVKLWTAYYKDISVNTEGKLHIAKVI